jgi:DMSO/TMAO reductase YedYZ molybdopterin-dependent catalytic subunit
MTESLKINGEVERPQEFSFDRLASLGEADQVIDVSRFGLRQGGDAVRLSRLLEIAGCKTSAKYVGLHATCDNYHASIPLEPIRETAIVVFRANGNPLDAKSGGPFRFFIPNHVPCQTGEIDACANVKFVDHIELLTDKGLDSRPNTKSIPN